MHCRIAAERVAQRVACSARAAPVNLIPMSTTPNEYAAARDPDLILRCVDGAPAIEAAWRLSRQTIARVSQTLLEADLPTHVRTVYVAGSIGRMEQLSRSDADVVVILDDSVDPDSDAAREAFVLVWNVLERCELERPKSAGIFSQPDTNQRLLDPTTRGLVDEDIGTFGRRIQMLLDSQPLFNPRQFDALQAAVVDRYLSSRSNNNEPWAYLLNDLIRYYRSLCVRTQWIADPVQWRLINVKLRHSRLLNYAGLLLLLGEGSRQENFSAFLQKAMRWTPLERVAAMFEISGAKAHQVIDAYNVFLQQLDDEDLLARLAYNGDDDLYVNDSYRELLSNSRVITRELTRFVTNRSDAWSQQLLEQLLF